MVTLVLTLARRAALRGGAQGQGFSGRFDVAIDERDGRSSLRVVLGPLKIRTVQLRVSYSQRSGSLRSLSSGARGRRARIPSAQRA
jgi:hypothetical protein